MMEVYGRNMLWEEGGPIISCTGDGKNILYEIEAFILFVYGLFNDAFSIDQITYTRMI
jgi:hypothetical protein